jgi:hypothetical protein
MIFVAFVAAGALIGTATGFGAASTPHFPTRFSAKVKSTFNPQRCSGGSGAGAVNDLLSDEGAHPTTRATDQMNGMFANVQQVHQDLEKNLSLWSGVQSGCGANTDRQQQLYVLSHPFSVNAGLVRGTVMEYCTCTDSAVHAHLNHTSRMVVSFNRSFI